MASLLPRIILLALGAGALGGPDALRLLLQFAGWSPLVDLAISIFLIGMVTAHVMGTMLLARYVRNARTGVGARRDTPGVAATNRFAQMTLMVSLGVAFLVTACLLVVPLVASGDLGNSPFIDVLVIGAAAATVLPCTIPLLRIFREAGNTAPSAARATERFASMIQTAYFISWPLVAAFLLLVISFVASGGLDVQSLFPGFPRQSPSINMPVGTAIATVAGTTFLVRFLCRARNAAGAGAPAAATGTERFAKLTQVTALAAVVLTLVILLVVSYAPPGLELDGGKRA